MEKRRFGRKAKIVTAAAAGLLLSGAASDNITSAFSDYDDGRQEYDVENRYNGYEYDFEIDGATGQILSKDVDGMDHDDHYD